MRWDTTTAIKELTYATGKFKSVVWHASTSVLIDVSWELQLEGTELSNRIPLFSANSPFSIIPVPILEMMTVNTDLNIALVLTAACDTLTAAVDFTWRVAAQMDFEWEIECSKDITSPCRGKIIQSKVTLIDAPNGEFNAGENSKFDYCTVSAALSVSVGVQFDELIAVNNELQVAAAMALPNSGSLLFSQMSVALADDVTVNLRIFTKDVTPLFNLPLYSADPIIISTDTCGPTTAPTMSPTQTGGASNVTGEYYFFVHEYCSGCIGGYMCGDSYGHVATDCAAPTSSTNWKTYTQDQSVGQYDNCNVIFYYNMYIWMDHFIDCNGRSWEWFGSNDIKMDDNFLVGSGYETYQTGFTVNRVGACRRTEGMTCSICYNQVF